MKTMRFTAYPNGYRCSEPGEQSGEYVNATALAAKEAKIDHLELNLATADAHCKQDLEQARAVEKQLTAERDTLAQQLEQAVRLVLTRGVCSDCLIEYEKGCKGCDLPRCVSSWQFLSSPAIAPIRARVRQGGGKP